MSRGSFRSLSVLFWLVALAIAALTFGPVSSRIEATHPGGGQGLTFVGIFAFFLVGLLIQARIEDAICPPEVPAGPQDDAGRRAELETRAAQALREHRPSEALALLESAELWAKALELARTLKDEEACGRCNFHLGRYDAARQHFQKAGNLEAAARVCYMMRHVSEARTLFQQAAAQLDEAKAPGHCAGLWDRGGETIRAARLYESIGDYKRLAECAEVLGQYARAQSARERHQLKLADERRQSATARSEKELRAEATRLGDRAMKEADFFAAGESFLDAAEYARAGEAFEFIEEWDRAARAYDLAGLTDQARQLRGYDVQAPRQYVHMEGLSLPAPTRYAEAAEQSPYYQPELDSNPPPGQVVAMEIAPGESYPGDPGTGTSAPAAGEGTGRVTRSVPKALPPEFVPHPSAQPRVVFVSANQRLTENVPVVQIAAPAPVAGSGTSRFPNVYGEIQSLVEKRQFDEAAALALQQNQYVQAAQYYEKGGNLTQAADVYRQIGKFDQAVSCLTSANLPKEAGLLAGAMGKRERAAGLLLDALEASEEPELAQMAAELLIEAKQFDRAMQLIFKRIAPEGVTEGNAKSCFEFARMFEDHGGIAEALSIYKKMVKAGAESEVLSERIAALEEERAMLSPFSIDLSTPAPVAGGVSALPLQQPAERTAEYTPEDLAQLETPVAGEIVAGEDVSVEATIVLRQAETPAPEPAKRFHFDAGEYKPREFRTPSRSAVEDPARVNGAAQLSLFCSPDDARRLAESTRAHSLGTPAAEGQGRVLNPFAPEHRYEIIREIGRGGMGVIYEAMDTALSRPVALKVIISKYADEGSVEQFLVEARAIARLSHPNVVAVYDMGMMDLKHYIAMELVGGQDLKGLIDTGEVLTVRECLRYFIETARGLGAAHEAGVVHRDIKPANLLLTEKRQVKIVDFGLAKLADKKAMRDRDEVAGTPGYMAPEQILGEALTPATDIYSLGITLFTLLIGQPPHKVDGVRKVNDILNYQVKGELPDLRALRSDVPDAIDQIFRYCTAARPADRYQSVEAFLPVTEQWYHYVE